MPRGMGCPVSALSKIGSLLVASVYVLGAIHDAESIWHLYPLGILLFPLALIWFPEVLGSATGFAFAHGTLDAETPAWLVASAGWFILVGLPVLIYLLNQM